MSGFESNKHGFLMPSFGNEYFPDIPSELYEDKTIFFAEEKYDNVFTSVGVHPHDSEKMNDYEFDKIKELLNMKKVIAIGEIGLDYFRNYSPIDVQKKVFKRFLNLAEDKDFPIDIDLDAKPNNIIEETEDSWAIDINPDLVGQIGVITDAHLTQGIPTYALFGIEIKSAWYNEKQLKLCIK